MASCNWICTYHPGNSNTLSTGDLNLAVEWGIPNFAIEPNKVWVGTDPYGPGRVHQSIVPSSTVLSGQESIYKDLIPLIPK